MAKFLNKNERNSFADCWANQLFFRVAPIAFISEINNLDVTSTVSMAFEPLIGTHKDAFAALPPIEWILLLKSILQKKQEIPNAWKRLEIDLDTNTYAKPIWDSRMVSGAYKNAQEDPIHELSSFSGLYMLKFVIGRVLLLERAKEWKKMPVWKVAMDRLISEGKILSKRDIITAGALSGAFLGAYWGIGATNPFYRKRLANQDDLFRNAQTWFESFAVPLEQPKSKTKKITGERTSNHFQPYFAHKDQKELKTVFYTVVVRNDALRTKYPGGVAAYHRKHKPTANRDICISCFMGGDVDACIDDLLLCGLMPPDDFICFDANDGTMFRTAEEIEGKTRDMGVSWLSGRYHNGYLWVKYEDGRKYSLKIHGYLPD